MQRTLPATTLFGRVRRWLLLAALTALLAGCGYTQDRARLPAQASSLAINKVRNSSFTGEIDVRFRQALRQRLLRNPAVRLEPHDRADLLLDVDLTDVSSSRSRDLTSGAVGSLVYNISGNFTLTERRTELVLIDRRYVATSAGRDFASPVLQTPAIRDEVIGRMLENLAEQVENALFYLY